MNRPQFLLAARLSLFTNARLHPRTIDPWRGWIVFKQFARLVDEVPEPGVTVQIDEHNPDGTVRLYYMRQVVEPGDDDWLIPAGGVVCEFVFRRGAVLSRSATYWSFDYPDFQHFVDAVEQDPHFADLTVRRPLRSRVYWEDS